MDNDDVCVGVHRDGLCSVGPPPGNNGANSDGAIEPRFGAATLNFHPFCGGRDESALGSGLTALVLIEKIGPQTAIVARLAAAALIVLGIVKVIQGLV